MVTSGLIATSGGRSIIARTVAFEKVTIVHRLVWSATKSRAGNELATVREVEASSVYHRPMDASPDLAAFVLAGGKSTRMGRDKAFVEFEGSTLLARALDLAHSVTSDVWIVGSREKFATFASVVEDVFCDCGPLAGIHAALQASQKELNLMLAVDTPFISSEFLQYLIGKARKSPEAQVAVPRADGRPQPLCAIYRREFVSLAQEALRSGRNKIGGLFDKVETRVIDEAELEAAGFSPSIFRNLNTQDELEAVKLNCGQAVQRSSNLLS